MCSISRAQQWEAGRLTRLHPHSTSVQNGHYFQFIPCYHSLLKHCALTWYSMFCHPTHTVSAPSHIVQGHNDFPCDYQWAKPFCKPLIPPAAGSSSKSYPWNPLCSQSSQSAAPLMDVEGQAESHDCNDIIMKEGGECTKKCRYVVVHI